MQKKDITINNIQYVTSQIDKNFKIAIIEIVNFKFFFY